MWYFLLHGGYIICEVTGKRKKGNGLEVPCIYTFTGTEKLIERIINSLLVTANGLMDQMSPWPVAVKKVSAVQILSQQKNILYDNSLL